MIEIPEQIRSYPLIKLCGPDCVIDSHGDCDHPGKRPVNSNWQNEDTRLLDLRRHIQNVGNYGVVPRSSNDLVVIDADDREYENLVASNLPPTFTVETGQGHHWYYKSDWSQNKRWSGEINGEIKSNNSQVVGPGSDHHSGQKYSVKNDHLITSINTAEIADFIVSVNEAVSVERGGSGSGGSGGSSPPSPQQIPDSLNFIRKASLREKVADILNDTDAGHNDRLWLAGWLYGAAGLRDNEIVNLIMAEARWSNLDREKVKQGVSEVIKYSDSSRGNNRSNYSNDGGKSGNPLEELPDKTMADWKQYTTEKNGSVVVRAGVEHIDPNKDDMDSWDTVSVLFGRMENDDEFGEIPSWDSDQFGEATKQLGSKSPNDLRMAAQALESLADDMES